MQRSRFGPAPRPGRLHLSPAERGRALLRQLRRNASQPLPFGHRHQNRWHDGKTRTRHGRRLYLTHRRHAGRLWTRHLHHPSQRHDFRIWAPLEVPRRHRKIRTRGALPHPAKQHQSLSLGRPVSAQTGRAVRLVGKYRLVRRPAPAFRDPRLPHAADPQHHFQRRDPHPRRHSAAPGETLLRRGGQRARCPGARPAPPRRAGRKNARTLCAQTGRSTLRRRPRLLHPGSDRPQKRRIQHIRALAHTRICRRRSDLRASYRRLRLRPDPLLQRRHPLPPCRSPRATK